MSRTVVSLRLTPAELQFVDRLAAEKSVSRAAVLHQLFLQQVALLEIEKSMSALLETRLETMRAGIAELHQKIEDGLTRDDLIKATNFIVKELKK